MNTFLIDLKHGLRLLLKNRAMTVVVVSTLALGISANTAIFSVAFASILRPLPFYSQERLFVAWKSDTTANNPFVELSVPEFNDWSREATLVDNIAAMPTTVYGYGLVLTGQGEPVQLESARVSADFFATLGVTPILGRGFAPDDDRVGATPVVVISNNLWRERFSSDPAVLGRVISLGERSFTIVGVMSREFVFPVGASLWTPLSASMGQRVSDNRGAVFLQAIGRLKPGVSLEQARTEFNTIIARIADEHPETESAGHRVVITPLDEYVFGSARPALILLLIATSLLLTIACVNIANLFLARAVSRRKELAIRVALGASRSRIIRQFLTESLVINIPGAAIGVLLAFWFVDLLRWAAPADIPRLADVRINGTVLLFSCFVMLITTLIVGLLPGIASSRISLSRGLNEAGSRVLGERSGGRLRSSLVVLEIALSVLLLAGAGLTVRTFQNLSRVHLGFDPRNVLTFQLSLQGEKYRDRAARRDFFGRFLNRLEEQPGVLAAGAVLIRPLEGTIGWDVPFLVEGQSISEARKNTVPNFESISPHYFSALGIAIKSGRDFTEQDNENSPPVAVMSASMAESFFPGEDAIGKRIKFGFSDPESRWTTIVGVVSDVRYREIKDSRWDVYVPYRQSGAPIRYVALRTSSKPSEFAGSVRQVLASLDSTQAITGTMTMEELVDRNLAPPRFNSVLLVWLAGLGGLLAGIGIYGTVSYSVTQRTQEIGIRMALGAQAPDVVRLVVRQAMVIVAFGLTIGVVGALAVTRLMRGLLFDVSATDPLTFAIIVILLGLAALLACSLPARRASRVDPMIALRCE
jgi:putative ABC transport system permease protein